MKMTNKEKINLLSEILETTRFNKLELVYVALNEMGDMKFNYYDYLTSEEINVERELERVDAVDYDCLCALLTMLLREDHFCEGSFEERWEKGQPQIIINRMIELLKTML